MIWVSIWLMLVGFSAVVAVRPHQIPALFLGFYWLSSFVAQSFALPMALLCLALFPATDERTRIPLVVATLFFGIAHWRNRRAGRRLLDAIGLRDRAIPFHAGLAPFLTGGGAALRIQNLRYGDAGERNLLDLIVPRAPAAAPMPILIHIPGGAWVTGKKNQQAKPLIHYLVSRGWLCVDMNYRLGPASRGPDWIVDVLKAIAWVRANAPQHGGDPARIAITGGSAGAHLAALAALAHDDPAFKPGFERADCSVAAAIPLYGRYDFIDRNHRLGRNHASVIDGFMTDKVMPGGRTDHAELWRSVSPVDRIRRDAPPMLVVHGTGDTMLPFEDARDFAAQLKAVATAPVTYVELPHIQHAWDMANSALAWAQARAIEAFLRPLVNRD
ncbi:alpha/beta hydrolase fold domain-containing protein [Sphingomonas tabacisoli]|uniref:Alpha/beta hydrolase fold domain-containing protein n=1 Tax=Sphingomonas tabacisoli TaxID=2249466 RepID=A0ABW4I5H2_9SPHN